MDELNPTVREQEIYEEMELTPEMIKSIRVSLSVSVTSCSPPAIPKRPADIVDEDKRTRYTEDGSGIRSNP